MSRLFTLAVIAVIAINLLLGRHRAAALVKSGRITKQELDSFTVGAFALLGAAFLGIGIAAEFSRQSGIACLMTFPPRSAAGYALWLIQAALSGTIVFWLWFRDGADLLARLAPAFTRGTSIDRKFSPSWVRVTVSLFVLGAPLLNIAMQLAQPVLVAGCENI